MPAKVMSLATATLPSDPDALWAFATRLQAELAARDSELYAKTHPWPPTGQGPA